MDLKEQQNCNTCKNQNSIQQAQKINQNLHKKYEDKFQFYLSKKINEILTNTTSSHVSIFKDYLFYDDLHEYLKRYYEGEEQPQRIESLTNFYNNVFPKIRPVFYSHDIIISSKMFKHTQDQDEVHFVNQEKQEQLQKKKEEQQKLQQEKEEQEEFQQQQKLQNQQFDTKQSDKKDERSNKFFQQKGQQLKDLIEKQSKDKTIQPKILQNRFLTENKSHILSKNTNQINQNSNSQEQFQTLNSINMEYENQNKEENTELGQPIGSFMEEYNNQQSDISFETNSYDIYDENLEINSNSNLNFLEIQQQKQDYNYKENLFYMNENEMDKFLNLYGIQDDKPYLQQYILKSSIQSSSKKPNSGGNSIAFNSQQNIINNGFQGEHYFTKQAKYSVLNQKHIQDITYEDESTQFQQIQLQKQQQLQQQQKQHLNLTNNSNKNFISQTERQHNITQQQNLKKNQLNNTTQKQYSQLNGSQSSRIQQVTNNSISTMDNTNANMKKFHNYQKNFSKQNNNNESNSTSNHTQNFINSIVIQNNANPNTSIGQSQSTKNTFSVQNNLNKNNINSPLENLKSKNNKNTGQFQQIQQNQVIKQNQSSIINIQNNNNINNKQQNTHQQGQSMEKVKSLLKKYQQHNNNTIQENYNQPQQIQTERDTKTPSKSKNFDKNWQQHLLMENNTATNFHQKKFSHEFGSHTQRQYFIQNSNNKKEYKVSPTRKVFASNVNNVNTSKNKNSKPKAQILHTQTIPNQNQFNKKKTNDKFTSRTINTNIFSVINKTMNKSQLKNSTNTKKHSSMDKQYSNQLYNNNTIYTNTQPDNYEENSSSQLFIKNSMQEIQQSKTFNALNSTQNMKEKSSPLENGFISARNTKSNSNGQSEQVQQFIQNHIQNNQNQYLKN